MPRLIFMSSATKTVGQALQLSFIHSDQRLDWSHTVPYRIRISQHLDSPKGGLSYGEKILKEVTLINIDFLASLDLFMLNKNMRFLSDT